MKKLFSKNETSQQNSLIGKVFLVGKFTVTVEDVIAEGILRLRHISAVLDRAKN